MPKKGQPIPLNTFLSGATEGSAPVCERLPEGPVVTPNGSSDSRKVWIAEWGGQEELNGHALTMVTTLDEFKAALDLNLREFILGGDFLEAARCIIELGSPQYHAHIVKRAVVLAMDKTGREREMIAVLLSSLHVRRVLSSQQVAVGFHLLLESMDDLLLDIPDAAGLVSHFLADSHLDGLLPLVLLEGLDTSASAASAAAGVLAQARARLRGRVPLSGSQIDSRIVRAELRNVVTEYLASKDLAEVGRRTAELCVPYDLQYELVRAAIELGLERGNQERELVSRLLSELHEDWLPASDVSRGFEALLARVDDLALDNPRAVEHLAAFMTRAVADEVLPPAWVTSAPPEKLTTPAQLAVISSARAPLLASHFGEKRRNVWGAAADGSLAELKKEVTELWQECAISGEVGEAVRCVRELEAHFYHHEVVKRAVGASIVDGGPREFELSLQFTKALCEADLLTGEQLALGCTRLAEAAEDLQLDYPKAPELLAQYLERCCALKLLAPTDDWHATAAALRGGGKANGTIAHGA